jgi:DNA (cytosine-5)-methyltransferase 1
VVANGINNDMATSPLYELSLFSGAGGGLLASKWLLGWRTVAYVEQEPYPVKVLKARIRDGYLDDAPIWDDVRTFRRDNPECGEFIERLAGLDNLVISGGFPCQPFSAAGKQLGEADERNMWPETARIIREIRPRFVFLENVAAIISSGYFGRILGDLAESGYDCRYDCLPASAVGANHQRDRVWIVGWNVADAARGGLGRQGEGHKNSRLGLAGSGEGQLGGEAGGDVADTKQQGLQGTARTWMEKTKEPAAPSWWQTQPSLGRVADGLADWLDLVEAPTTRQAQRMARALWEAELKALGNGQVPLAAAVAWRVLSARIAL